MKSAAVNAPFGKQMLGGDPIEDLPHSANELRLAAERRLEDQGRVHGEIDIGDSGLRVIENKAERAAGFGITTADIGAHDGRGRTVLLRVPDRAMPAQVSLVKPARATFFQIIPKRGVTTFDVGFGQLRIEKKQFLIELWDAMSVGCDLVDRNIARAGRIGRKQAGGSPRVSISSCERMK